MEKRKKILVFLVGASGAGKDTVADYMAMEHGFTKVVSYTTRKIREGEQQGREHYFVNPAAVENPQEWCKRHDLHCLAYTRFGDAWYWSTMEQLARCPNRVVYIIDEKGLLSVYNDEKLRKLLNKEFDSHVWKVLRTNNPTEAARQARDAERIELPEDWFTCIIRNDYDIACLFAQTDAATTRLTKKQ